MMRKIYYQKLTYLGLFLMCLFAFKIFTAKKPEKLPEVKFISEKSTRTLSEFNPNDFSKTQWINLGFTERQVATILKYKDIVGGEFKSKEQLQKCYAISEEKFNEIKDFILLPEKIASSLSTSSYPTFSKKALIIRKKFNPDFLTQSDWEDMGFSQKQASAILKYKSYLGGSFVSKEKFKECFIINDEHYQQLSAYLILPERTPDNFKKYPEKSENKIIYTSFDPNTLDITGWKKLGFSDKQAQVIINYKERNLKGAFSSLEDFKNCFVISTEKFEALKPFIHINSKNIVSKENPKSIIKQEKTDFSKINMNEITFKQLLEYGLDEKAAGSLIGFRKKLGGFVTKEQILETYNIDKEMVKNLLNITFLDATNVQKYTLVDAPEEWLKNHPYFKYSADKIIYYRTSYPDDKKIWKNLKVKPEYEARMKLYLK